MAPFNYCVLKSSMFVCACVCVPWLHHQWPFDLQKFTNQQHIFSILVSELKSSETATYRVTLMSFINVILRGHSEGKIRSRVRDQFIGKHFQSIDVNIKGYIYSCLSYCNTASLTGWFKFCVKYTWNMCSISF